MTNDKKFADGLIYKAPKPGSPDFVKGKVSVKVDEFKKFLDENNDGGWVNLDFLKSKAGKFYFVLNDWKPQQQAPSQQGTEIDVSKIDF